MKLHLDTTWETETLSEVNLRIYYNRTKNKLYIEEVMFEFDNDVWLKVPDKWRNTNLEHLRDEVEGQQ
jgi:hypothetical protein